MLIKTRDRLVRPAKQRELTKTLNAYVIKIDADHDLPLVKGAEYARLTMRAIDTVAASALPRRARWALGRAVRPS